MWRIIGWTLLAVLAYNVTGYAFGWWDSSDSPTPASTPTISITFSTTRPPLTVPPSTTSTTAASGLVRDGEFEFELLEWFYVEGPDLPDEVCAFFCDEALGQWLVVRARIENIGTHQQDFTPIFQELEFQGRTYDGSEGSRAELNPGLATEVLVAFDVPLDFPETGDGVVVKFHDDVWSGGALICLRHC